MNRIRVGVGPLPDYITPADYVLQPFSGKEETLIPDLLTIHIEILKTWIAEGIDNCMNTYNKKYFLINFNLYIKYDYNLNYAIQIL